MWELENEQATRRHQKAASSGAASSLLASGGRSDNVSSVDLVSSNLTIEPNILTVSFSVDLSRPGSELYLVFKKSVIFASETICTAKISILVKTLYLILSMNIFANIHFGQKHHKQKKS